MFDKCNTIEEIKQQFRRIAKRIHPDNGGNVNAMQELTELRDMAIARVEHQQGCILKWHDMRDGRNMW